MTWPSVVLARLAGGTWPSLLTPVTPASDPPGLMTGNADCAEPRAIESMKSATVIQVPPMSGSGVMMSPTRSPARAAAAVSAVASAAAALITNTPIRASHSPSASAQSRTSPRPAIMSTAPMARPAAAADCAARTRSPVRRHRNARRIRPPSSGAPGSRLKTASRAFIAASQPSAATAIPGPPPARTAAAIPPKISPAARLAAGPAAAIRTSARAVDGSPPSSDTPPSAHSVIEVTGTP